MVAYCGSSPLATDELYTFKDFDLVISEYHFGFSYPSYINNIRRKDLYGGLNYMKLYSKKTDEFLPVQEIVITRNHHEILTMPYDQSKNLSTGELDSIFKGIRNIELWVPPIEFPLNCKFSCGKELLEFQPIKLNIVSDR